MKIDARSRVMAYREASLSEFAVSRSVCLLVVVGFLASCGPPSIETLCEDLSVTQCATCFSCDIDGADACDLAPGADQTTCEADLALRCADQAATLERPKKALQDCTDSLEQLTCDTLVRGVVQNSPHTTEACVYFL